jgi:hypothetical protein
MPKQPGNELLYIQPHLCKIGARGTRLKTYRRRFAPVNESMIICAGHAFICRIAVI